MGYRATITSVDWNVDWPKWIRDKHEWVDFSTGVVRTFVASKLYLFGELVEDLRKVIQEMQPDIFEEEAFTIAILWESGIVEVVDIFKDRHRIYGEFPAHGKGLRKGDYPNVGGHCYWDGWPETREREAEGY